MRRRHYLHRVIEAITLGQACRQLAHSEFSLIVLDLGLDDGDGRDFPAELRADHSLDDVPILVLTAARHPRVRAECLALGANEVHHKPPDALALDQAFSVLTGHEDRASLALMGDQARCGCV